jgi:hypothetical protein
VPQRHSEDPSASLVAADFSGRQIECVLDHRRLTPAGQRQPLRNHVSGFEYECRLAVYDASDATFAGATHWFSYDDIKHSFAFDCYVMSRRSLEGHLPICHMPAAWSPHAVFPALRPAHLPLPVHEFRAMADSPSTSELDE